MRGSPRALYRGVNPLRRMTWDHGGVTNTPRTRVSDRFNAITPSATLAVDAKAPMDSYLAATAVQGSGPVDEERRGQLL